MMKLRIFSIILGLGILAGLVYFSDWEDVLNRTKQADWALILLGVLISFALMILKTFRWDILLKKAGISIKFYRAFYVYMAGLYISNLTPGRLGEPVRSYILKRRQKISFSKTLPSVLLERILDTIALIILAGLGVISLYNVLAYKTVIAGMVIVYMVLITLFFYVCSSTRRIGVFTRLLYRFFGWIPPLARHREDIQEKIMTFHDSLAIYNSPGIITSCLLLSVFIWGAEGFILKLVLASLGVEADLVGMMGILAISLLIAVLTSLPGGLGSQEALMVFLLSSCYGYPLGLTTSAVLIYRAISFWLNLVVGGVAFSAKS